MRGEHDRPQRKYQRVPDSPVLSANVRCAEFRSAHSAPAGKDQWFGRHVVAVTHNGGEQEFPQDTLFALHSAQALHMQVLDVDIQMSKDNVPVLIHSETLTSSTNGHGKVSDFTAVQLAQLDAAYQWVPGCGTCGSQPASAHPYVGCALAPSRCRRVPPAGTSSECRRWKRSSPSSRRRISTSS